MRRTLSLVMLSAAVLGTTAGQAGSVAAPPVRVTVIGDSIAAAIEYDPTAQRILARGVDLDLQLAACRRLVGDSCPYQGLRPPTLVALLPSLRLGSTVVVVVGYNDYEDTFSESVEKALQALDETGVEHILWLTLRAERQSYLRMNDIIRTAAARHPEMTVVDWNLFSKNRPDWFQPDGLHLTRVGAIGMATLVQRSLDERGLVAAPRVSARAIAITTRTLPTARVGRRYSIQLSTRGGVLPVRWKRAAGVLPAGLALRPSGMLEGLPRAVGRRPITLRATDVQGRSVTRRFLLSVAAR